MLKVLKFIGYFVAVLKLFTYFLKRHLLEILPFKVQFHTLLPLLL